MIIDNGPHTYSGNTCTVCGYTNADAEEKAEKAEKPETGDITNIPLWTGLFLGGVALLWFQLEQRRRSRS